MKKAIVSLAVWLICMGAGNSFAEMLQLQTHTIEAGPEISYIKYEEPTVMREKGFMFGGAVSYAYHKDFMFKGEGHSSIGYVDYENSGTIDDIFDFMFEGRVLGGYDFPVLETSVFTPFIGFGYRYLMDDSGGKTSSTGAAGYKRESNYLYSPIGIETLTKLEKQWYAGIILEYDYFWIGRQISHLEDVSANYDTLENNQNEGYGLRGSVRFLNKGDFPFVIEPFIRYWKIQKSEEEDVIYSGAVIGYGWEPKNNSTEIGLKFLFSF